IATKSRSISPVGLIAMSLIILVIASSFSFRNGASSTTAAVAGCAVGWASCASKCDGTANARRRRAPKTAVLRPGLGNLPDSAVATLRKDGRYIFNFLGGCAGCIGFIGGDHCHPSNRGCEWVIDVALRLRLLC